MALEHLHISAKALAKAPPITELLRDANGGLPQVIAAMRFAPDEVISTFLAKYDSIAARDRDRLPLEAIGLAAKVDINALMVSIMLALQAQAVHRVKIIAVTNHPKITAARVKYGQRGYGERDRTALDTAMGFLPSPKGPTFIGKAVFGSGRNVMDAQGGEDDGLPMGDDSPDLDKLFPPANAMQLKLTPIRQRTPPE